MPQPSAKITAQKNGASWSPVYANGVLTEFDTLKISATSEVYQSFTYDKIDTFNITIKYTSPGTYQLKTNQAFYGVFNKGAVTWYQLDKSYNNVIDITAYERINADTPNGPFYAKITGTFNLRFVDPDNPSGISFQNGSFYALLYNQ